MKTSLSNLSFKFFTVFSSLILVVLLSSCEKENISGLEDNVLDAKAQKIGKANMANGFQAFHQGFNHDTDAWADQDVEGVLGWCGTISLHDRKTGGVEPSAGNGYATVMWGDCNAFWQADPSEIPLKEEEGLPAFQESAPATQDPALWSSSWPASGYLQDLDIYLDPGMFEEGVAFTYSQSIKSLEETAFSYFGLNVMKTGGDLYINDFQISEEGWYTFSFIFSDDEGYLTLVFQLLQRNKVVYSFPIENTLFEPASATSSFEVHDFGSGYIWFAYLQEGVALPIDEQFLRPGK